RSRREAGTPTESGNTGGFGPGIAHDGAGRLYVCDAGRKAILRVDPGTGGVEVWCDSAAGGPLETPNYLAFAADGGRHFSHSGAAAPELRKRRHDRVSA